MQVKFGNYDCHVLFHEYANPKNVCIQLVDIRDGMPVATATLNPDIELEEGMVCIKTYSENKGMFEVLKDAGIISGPVTFYQAGFVTVPICMLLNKPFAKVNEVCKVNWIVRTEEYVTYEFETIEDIWIEEGELHTDLFRLFLWNDNKIEIHVANTQDYDVHETVTDLFDENAIYAICEASQPDIEDHTEPYNEYYAKQEEVVHIGGSTTHECSKCNSRLIEDNKCLTCDSTDIKEL